MGKQATYTVAQHEAKEKLGIKSSSWLSPFKELTGSLL